MAFDSGTRRLPDGADYPEYPSQRPHADESDGYGETLREPAYEPGAAIPPPPYAASPHAALPHDSPLFDPLPPPTWGPPASVTSSEPAPAKPERDRVWVHFLWEFLLALGLAAAGFATWRYQRSALRGDDLQALATVATILGFLALAGALSLRAAVPNLAIGPAMIGSAWLYAHFGSHGTPVATALTLATALAVGVVIGLLVVIFQVPAWAASAAAGGGVLAFLGTRNWKPVAVADIKPTWWVGAIVGISVAGGLWAMFPSIRRTAGKFRPTADPARREGFGAGVIAWLALAGSTVLAAAAGIVLSRVAPAADSTLSDPFGATLVGLGIALLGGVSAFGRRGGVFGTSLALGLVALAVHLANTHRWDLGVAAFGAAAVGLGLLVTRFLEWTGRRRVEPDVPNLAPEPPPIAPELDPPPARIPGFVDDDLAWPPAPR